MKLKPLSPSMKKFHLANMVHAIKTGKIDDARNLLALGHVTRSDFRKAMTDIENHKHGSVKEPA